MNASEIAPLKGAGAERGQALKCLSIFASIIVVAAIDLLFFRHAAALVS